MIELGHAAMTANHGLQHIHHGICAEAMPLGDFVNDLLPSGRKFSHDDPQGKVTFGVALRVQ
ncbi:hypothetical protein [Cupriavidus pauculus]|uniref:hypothetical protein n=1 Tax=Cupriavidus pauculus TaxID=82633 RepID=UPI0035B5014F